MDARFLDKYGETAFGHRKLGPPHWLMADSIAALAEKIGVPGAGLEDTVSRFNKGAREGHDPEFRRGESITDQEWGDGDQSGGRTCLAPLEAAPYAATRVYAGCSGTTGGPTIDGESRVLDENGAPIAGLYAAGNIVAGLFGDAAPASGSTLGPGMTFGYLAGRAIARSAVATPA
jgi:hypothetical protein